MIRRNKRTTRVIANSEFALYDEWVASLPPQEHYFRVTYTDLCDLFFDLLDAEKGGFVEIIKSTAAELEVSLITLMNSDLFEYMPFTRTCDLLKELATASGSADEVWDEFLYAHGFLCQLEKERREMLKRPS